MSKNNTGLSAGKGSFQNGDDTRGKKTEVAMGFSCGIVGLPNVGKSTLFNALTALNVPAEAFPFCTIEPNTGKVPVPDEWLTRLAEMFSPEKITPTVMEFVDIAGLVKGASRGEGLGNQFLGHIRSVNAVAHVVRCFENANIPHVTASIQPASDIETIELELILADLETVQRRLDKLSRLAKVGDKSARKQMETLSAVQKELDRGVPARDLTGPIRTIPDIMNLNLITAKPVMLILNVSEDDLQGDGPLASEAAACASQRRMPVVVISSRIEAELAALSADEQAEYRRELGISHHGLARVISSGYSLLGLITFYTTVGPELRAWTIPEGTSAQSAAGRIHSDMERGFIRADVISVEDLLGIGSETAAREQGRIRSEGRDYLVRNRDVIRFKFNV